VADGDLALLPIGRDSDMRVIYSKPFSFVQGAVVPIIQSRSVVNSVMHKFPTTTTTTTTTTIHPVSGEKQVFRRYL
jgi:hypothetical protein